MRKEKTVREDVGEGCPRPDTKDSQLIARNFNLILSMMEVTGRVLNKEVL